MTVVTGWDCHAHLFGPYSRHPLARERSYTPPEAPLAAYLALLARLGLSHGVLVHPSAYGDNCSLVLDTLAAQPQLRGVLVTRGSSLPQLTVWRAHGVRALRFSHRSAEGGNFAGSASLSDLLHMAPMLADAGMHAELWTDCRALAPIEGLLERLPVPLVIDHMGGFDSSAGVDDPGFRVLLSLLERGHVWVKLCVYRNLLLIKEGMEAGRPFHDRLLETNPRQLLWGSDWPHLRVTPAPATESLLSTFRQWTGDAALQRAILVDNPSRLYD